MFMTVNPLHRYLRQRKLRQEDFAPHVGISRSYLSRLLRGECEADATFLAEVEKATDRKVTASAWVRWWSNRDQSEAA